MLLHPRNEVLPTRQTDIIHLTLRRGLTDLITEENLIYM